MSERRSEAAQSFIRLPGRKWHRGSRDDYKVPGPECPTGLGIVLFPHGTRRTTKRPTFDLCRRCFPPAQPDGEASA